MPIGKLAGFAVHIFTATGAVCGLMALHFAAVQQWAPAFAWLGAAAIIDGADGPIARRIGVEKTLPRFSGLQLDLVVDYLTYCVVPAFILSQSGRAGDPWSLVLACAMVLSALFHFADTQSKTPDGYFVGFPGIWNVVVFYFFIFDTSPEVTLGTVLILVVLTFVPLKWVHPLRGVSYRYVTYAVMALWAFAAAYEVLEDFPGEILSRSVLGFCGGYLIAISLYRSLGAGRSDADHPPEG